MQEEAERGTQLLGEGTIDTAPNVMPMPMVAAMTRTTGLRMDSRAGSWG